MSRLETRIGVRRFTRVHADFERRNRKVKRSIGSLLILSALMLVSAQALHAEANVVVKELVTITVDKAQVRSDVPPINVQGQTLVPIRGVFNAFNATISWIPGIKRAVIQKTNTLIRLRAGVAHAQVNGRIVPLAVPATLYRGRIMVPLRFVAETLGATVTWDPASQTITILTRGKATVQPNGPPAMAPGQPGKPPAAQPAPAEQPEQVSPPDDSGEYEESPAPEVQTPDNGGYDQGDSTEGLPPEATMP